MRIITLDINKTIIGIKNVSSAYLIKPGLQTNEVVSDIGEMGQIQQTDGSFVTPTVASTSIVEPSLEDKVNYLYYKSKGVIS